MIVRWFMALSQYSYEIEFISGNDNGIADSMSRLCRNYMTDLPHVYNNTDILCSNIIEKFKLTTFQCKLYLLYIILKLDILVLTEL